MLLNKLKVLENNPRQITEKQFNKLKKSLKEFMEMLEIRQIVYDDDFVIWGGNQRFRAYKMLVEQGELEYNDKYFKKLPSNWSLDQKKEFAIKDNNPQGLSGSFDDDILANEWDDLPLEEWGIEVPTLDENPYTALIQTPTYEVTGEKPNITNLYDKEYFNKLIDEIDNADIPEEVKDFLRLASYRHIVFDFEKIAEFYAHQPKEIQELMENNALVIIDFNKAIELGYVELSDNVKNAYRQDYE